MNVFNNFPNLELNIVGYCPLEEQLKKISKNNINFLGKIENENLGEVYQENHVFILPSKSEPWGLVVEEALNNGLPVILSNRVGCSTEVIENNIHGYIYNVNKDEELIEIINKILITENYNKLKLNVEKLDFNKIKEDQINSYLI